MRVQLILPPVDERYHKLSRSGCFPPLGLTSVATYLEQELSLEQMEILDGELLQQAEILARLSADVVGISVSILSYHNSVEIMRQAKAKGSLVIVGGHHATAMPEKILRNRPSADFVICDDGEIPTARLLRGEAKQFIPNLAFRDGSAIVRNKSVNTSLDAFPIPSRKFLDFPAYWANWQAQNPNKPFRRPTSIYSQKGCAWRDKTGGCVFCGRMDMGWRGRSTKRVWEEVEYLVKEYKIDYIWEACDTVLSDKDWFSQFAEDKPPDINPAFLFYARVDEITPETVKHLKRVNAYEVFLGVESGDEGMMKSAIKGASVRRNLRAAELLRDNGIKIFPSFVLGLPGESNESLKHSIDFAHQLSDLGNVDVMAVSILMPLPGSKSLDMLLSLPEMKEKYGDTDDFELEGLQRDWVMHFCRADFEAMQDARDEMLQGVTVKSGYNRQAMTISLPLNAGV
jgi:anaerobic magnesium-protoporphyrin IX monomethyl ester cyclase